MHHQRNYPMLAFSLALMIALFGLSSTPALAGTMTDPGVAPPPFLDIWIDKTFTLDEETLIGFYHITVTNHGCGRKEAAGKNAGIRCTARDIGVEETMNDELVILSWTTTQGTFDGEFWSIGDLEEDESASLWIDFQVVEQGFYENWACVVFDEPDRAAAKTADGPPEPEELCAHTEFLIVDRQIPDFVPERSPGGITDRGPRFAADLEAGKEVAVDGNTATYTITVENLGPSSTAKVQATDHLPDCLEFDSSDADRGSYDPDTWIWDIGALKVGETATLTITATITDACTGTVTNTVSVSRSSLPDPGNFFNLFDEGNSAANNSASASFDAGSGRVLAGAAFELGRNYPNPFNPTTIVPFAMAEASHVSIRVYDLLGREVKVLVDGEMAAGVHEVVFEANNLPTGVYLIRMQAAGIVQTQRVTLMK